MNMLRSSLFLCLALLAPPLDAFVATARTRFAIIQASSPRQVSPQQEVYSTSINSNSDDGKTEYAAIFPGSEVRIQVGNVELARKAWKKRRRSGSPVLIPCSVLDLDRTTLVVDNIVYLIQKFGTPMSESKLELMPEGYKGKDICLSMSELNQNCRKHLGSSLAKQAVALGFETSRDLVESLMTKDLQSKLDVQLFSADENLWFLTHMSRYRGHRLAEEASLLQFEGGVHTGVTRRKSASSGFDYVTLSAALRVSQRAVDNGLISEGSVHKAQVFGLDPLGDGGSPLLKLSLHTERKMSKNKRIIEVVDARMIQIRLGDLKVGAGPFKGKVTRVSNKSMAAFVDIGVGRSVKKGQMTKVMGMLRFDDLNRKNNKENMAFALELDLDDEDEVEEEINVIEAALNNMEYDDDDDIIDFDEHVDDDLNGDMVDDIFAQSEELDNAEEDFEESDDEEESMINTLLGQSKDEDEDGDEDDEIISEEEEDITHLVSIKDGNISYKDPETGEVVNLGSLYDGEQGDNDLDDSFFGILSPEESLQVMGDMIDNDETDTSGRTFVKLGDEIDVYIHAVSKQSGRFMLTTRPVVQKMKEVKKETQAEKKLERLIAKMGGDISNILKLGGTECDGVITATSKTGGWLYVEPLFQDLPVGVAQVADGISIDSLSKGDSVRIRLEGIDKTRGQLAMTVIDKQ